MLCMVDAVCVVVVVDVAAVALMIWLLAIVWSLFSWIQLLSDTIAAIPAS